MHKGDNKKAPGRDGVGFQFFKVTWGALKHILDLFTQMFTDSTNSEQHKRGVIVCIPKIARPYQPMDFRPITLLNTYYKILARIIAGRIRPAQEELLHPSQYCGRPGNMILDALATVRDAIA
jgi:mannosylglycoprotein endo-beta-mannosidase